MTAVTAVASPFGLPGLPRVLLLDGPTPLQPLRRLSEALGGRAELWIKREDLGPLAFAGNKLRNLEFLLAAAIVDGAEAIVTSGRRWSNHCRLTAAAGARLGLEVHVVLSGPPVAGSPNVQLIETLGGIVHQAQTDDRAERAELVSTAAAELRAAGRRVTVVPVGGSDPTGAWGQLLAGIEVTDQAKKAGFAVDSIVLPTATGGTQAGLIVGTAIAATRTGGAEPGARTPPRVVGVVVAHSAEALRPHVADLVETLASSARFGGPLPAIELDESQIGAGYGIPSPAAVEAARLVARTEGILVDPVYTAKGLAGLLELVRSGELDGLRAVYWHGGGLPALFETLEPTRG